jgi:hypothetical protein
VLEDRLSKQVQAERLGPGDSEEDEVVDDEEGVPDPQPLERHGRHRHGHRRQPDPVSAHTADRRPVLFLWRVGAAHPDVH